MGELSFKERIALWAVVRRLKKELKKMKPLPKWVGFITLLLSLVVPGGALAGLISAKIAAIALVLLNGIQSVSHSLNGSGGSTENP